MTNACDTKYLIRNTKYGSRPGTLLVETLLGIAVFSLFVTTAFLTILLGQESSIQGGDRIRATYLSERAIEVARSLRQEDFGNLAAGTNGVDLGPNGTWVLSGSSVTTSDGFTTALTIAELEDDWVRVTAETTWSHGGVSSGGVVLDAELTDWRRMLGGDWSVLTLVGSYEADDDDPPIFNDIAVSGSGDYAFVTSDTDEGEGLYVFDISDLSSPQRVATDLSLSGDGFELAVKGMTLYVVVDDNNEEVQAYDVTSPAGLTGADRIATYNLPGNGVGRSLALDGDTLYVGAQYQTQGGRYELYAFDVSSPSNIDLLDDLQDSGDVQGIAVAGTSAYLASSMDSSELRVVDISSPSSLQFAPGEGYDLSDTPDGTAVSIGSAGVVLGRAAGDTTSEFARLDVEGGSGIPTPPPGPWEREIGANVNDLAVETTQCAAFVASDSDGGELSVVNIQDQTLPELTSYDADTGAGRGVHHDQTLDRLFLVTNSALYIFAPDPGPWSCP